MSHSDLGCVQVCAELRYDLSQALLKKDEAERELRDSSTKTGRQIEKAAQVGRTQDSFEQIEQPEFCSLSAVHVFGVALH